MIDPELVSTFISDVQLAGAVGSAEYNAALAQLEADAATARAKLRASLGKNLVGMSAGSAATWQVDEQLKDLVGAYNQALKILAGMVPIVRVTSGRFYE